LQFILEPRAITRRLLHRYPDLKEDNEAYAKLDNKKADDYVELFSRRVATAHYNERSQQIQTIRRVFFTEYDWTLAENALKDTKAITHIDAPMQTPPMCVSDMLKEDGLDKIDQLRAALLSEKFYTHKNLYHCFCSGIESGILRGLTECENVKRLEDLLSVGAETHIRAELWYTLSEYGFSHNIGKDHRVARLKTFKSIGQAVRDGRSKYGDEAWDARQADMDSESDNDEDGEDEDEDENDDGSGATGSGAKGTDIEPAGLW
jgi:hypothetical protein